MKIEIHTHTYYSNCASAKPKQIIQKCLKNQVDAIFITDHNTIKGALELQELAPDSLKVIMGEEVSTKDGEILGIFLREEISGKDKSGLEVISEIRAQGGLSIVPHPFDTMRHSVMKDNPDAFDQIAKSADFFEIFNARCVTNSFNDKALTYAKSNDLVTVVGSDAHLPMEFGNTSITIDTFSTAKEFVRNIKSAKFSTRKATPLVHLGSRWCKIKHKLFAK